MRWLIGFGLQEALLESVQAFGRASHYTLIARGHVVEVLLELDQPVRFCSTLASHLYCTVLYCTVL